MSPPRGLRPALPFPRRSPAYRPAGKQPADGRVRLVRTDGEPVELNPTAAMLWRLCDGRRSVDNIVDLIAEAYPGNRRGVDADVRECLDQLASTSLIEWTNGPGVSVDVPILLYHHVSHAPVPGCSQGVSATRFEVQMAALKDAGFESIALEDFVALRCGLAASAPERPFILTFDDGYRGFAAVARPIIERYGFRATVFLATGYIGSETRAVHGWEVNEGATRAPMLLWSEVEQLHAAGHGFGSHTERHANLARLPERSAQREVERPAAELLAHLGDIQLFFAYPYGAGAGSTSLARVLLRSGYRGALATVPGVANTLSSDIWALPRLKIVEEDDPAADPDQPGGFWGRLGATVGTVRRQNLDARTRQCAGAGSDRGCASASPEIDAVFTWVDGAAPGFGEARARRLGPPESTGDALATSRHRDNGELRYALRSLESNAPWFRKVYLVTDGSFPSWLETGNPRLELVSHESIFPERSDLPTFNSHAIEVHLHRIPGLSRRYVYFNDDVFLGRPAAPELFLAPDGMQAVFLEEWAIPIRPASPVIIDRAYAFTLGLLGPGPPGATDRRAVAHAPQMYDRDLMGEIERRWGPELRATSSHACRAPDDVALRILYYHWALENEPHRRRHRAVTLRDRTRDYWFAMLNRDEAAMAAVFDGLQRLRPQFFCVNDDLDDSLEAYAMLARMRQCLEHLFPRPSCFERTQLSSASASAAPAAAEVSFSSLRPRMSRYSY